MMDERELICNHLKYPLRIIAALVEILAPENFTDLDESSRRNSVPCKSTP
jgi:hypothetical protein